MQALPSYHHPLTSPPPPNILHTSPTLLPSPSHPLTPPLAPPRYPACKPYMTTVRRLVTSRSVSTNQLFTLLQTPPGQQWSAGFWPLTPHRSTVRTTSARPRYTRPPGEVIRPLLTFCINTALTSGLLSSFLSSLLSLIIFLVIFLPISLVIFTSPLYISLFILLYSPISLLVSLLSRYIYLYPFISILLSLPISP